MAVSESFMEFVTEQMAGAGRISTKRMFGSYCIYCDGKPVAFLGEDRVLVKPTEAGRAFVGDGPTAELFPGSKQWLLVEDRYEDHEWLTELIRRTAEALPAPKPRKPRAGVKRKNYPMD
jgi:TfoX/Sxy family transcriptional regulator of competence genes